MIMVTGATGHIGNVLVRILLERGYKVSALVMPGDDLTPLKGLPVDIRYGDVTDYSSLLNTFTGIDYLYHLAGIVSIGSGHSKEIFKVNVGGTANVIKACQERKLRRLVYASSIHAFPEPPAGKRITEIKDFDPSRVVGIYGKSKAWATGLILKAARQGLDAVVVHPTGVIGPHDYKLSNMGQLIIDFLNNKLFAYIDGSYDFVDVRDVATGMVLACEKGASGENYILSGQEVIVQEILNYLREFTGKKGPRIKLPLWFAKLTAPFSELYYKILRQQPLYTPYSIYTLNSSLTCYSKAKKELGYNPRPVKETIQDTVIWLKKYYGIK